MTDIRHTREGWCPSLLRPMASGDGLLVRVKPTASSLSIPTIMAIAEAASRFGNGVIELTNRANLQIRGLRPETIGPFAEIVLAQGAAVSDPAVEQIRNVLASPLGADDPTAAFDAAHLAHTLETHLADDPRLTELPPKFGFLVDAGGALPLPPDVEADIMLRAAPGGIALSLAGARDRVIEPPRDAARTAIRLALAFLDSAGTSEEKPHRMRALVEAVGAGAVFHTAGLVASALPDQPLAAAPFAAAPLPFAAVTLPYGQIHAAVLLELAAAARDLGAHRLATTPWRTFIVPNLTDGNAARLLVTAASLGLVVAPGDPRATIIACPGSPACAKATVATHRDAAFLVATGVIRNRQLHVSGCIKGCARPRSTDFTLAGNANGRYSLVRGGRAGDPPMATDLTLEQVAQHMREN